MGARPGGPAGIEVEGRGGFGDDGGALELIGDGAAGHHLERHAPAEREGIGVDRIGPGGVRLGRRDPAQLPAFGQANAAGRYWHAWDNHPAPLDPHFEGVGRCFTDDEGRYRFITIRPGSYPWGNHFNAWRPAHIHFSLFGRAFAQRLVTQMYFPGDPMFDHDPIFNSVREPEDRARLIAAFDWEATTPEWALGYRFDIVLRGRESTPFEEPRS